MSKNLAHRPEQNESNMGSFKSYTTGFIASIILTVLAYLSTTHHLMSSKTTLIGFIIGLALIQFVVQMVLFLHLGSETKPRWKLLVFFFMIMVVLILVFGSLWIMSNLNYRMTPEQVNTYMQNQGGF